ncbi:hypothetical protein ACVIWV_009699 [Bradyrhizobium diazoefficiens]|jgi:hypothetical protein|nr:hypothetical protein [Bradyrhizobium japonicum]MCP1866320.1 hypothetical protein [Bradyrhizobium japonicum]MCP1955143.1 hypothetical protein [Bradyrhizobium japonicum]
MHVNLFRYLGAVPKFVICEIISRPPLQQIRAVSRRQNVDAADRLPRIGHDTT